MKEGAVSEGRWGCKGKKKRWRAGKHGAHGKWAERGELREQRDEAIAGYRLSVRTAGLARAWDERMGWARTEETRGRGLVPLAWAARAGMTGA